MAHRLKAIDTLDTIACHFPELKLPLSQGA